MGSSNCDTCAYNVYDEEDECYYCEVSMDEDDMVRLMEGHYRACPYLCTAPCRGNMPLRRRTGRAASRGRWLFPTRLETGTSMQWLRNRFKSLVRHRERAAAPDSRLEGIETEETGTEEIRTGDKKMVIIAGLGNPTKEYENTRHNIGFMAVDALADKYNISVMDCKHRALVGKGMIGGTRVVLVKPLTYMNLSGEAIRAVVDYYKVDAASELIVIYDDISLDVGQLRIRKKGSAGGHNGIKNIIANLGDDTFLRIKIGVGEKPKGYDLVDYVLGHFGREELEVITESLENVDGAVNLMLGGEVDMAMNKYNVKKSSKDDAQAK